MLKPLPILTWKWEQISMDFVTGLPKSKLGHDAIWVIVDRLTKSAHFLLVSMTYTVDALCKLYVKEIVRDFMECLLRLFLIETPDSLQSFGEGFRKPWVLP